MHRFYQLQLVGGLDITIGTSVKTTVQAPDQCDDKLIS